MKSKLCCTSFSIIYNPQAADNEEKSAELFKEFADEAGLKVFFVVFQPPVQLCYLFYFMATFCTKRCLYHRMV